MKVKNYIRDFLGEIYSEQLFLSPLSSLVRKPFVFVKNHIYVGITSSNFWLATAVLEKQRFPVRILPGNVWMLFLGDIEGPALAYSYLVQKFWA